MSYNSLLGLGSHSVDANLLCHLPMQETSGTTVSDRSGNSYNGTLSGETSPTTATGPNSYLTSAYDFDGTDDVVTLNTSTLVGGANERTVLLWFRPNTSFNGRLLDIGDQSLAANGEGFYFFRSFANTRVNLTFRGSTLVSDNGTILDNTWYHLAARVNASAVDTQDTDIFIDGTKITWTEAGTVQTLNTQTDANKYLGGGIENATPQYADAVICEYAMFNRALTDAEVAEIYNGPEPENTVAPTVSGDTAQGSTLTCSPGTWALPSPYASGSNGTITYQYQWTRDGGDISGATSSTYVTQAADIGTAVGCKVLGVNDGGSDSAEQTASSNSISVVASGPTYRMNMRLFIPTQV